MCMDTHTHAHTHYSTFCTSSVPGLFADLPSSPLLLATITLAPWGLAAPSGPCAPCSDNWSVQRCLFHWALTLHLAAHTHRLNIPKDSTLCMAVKCYVFRFPSMTHRKPYKRPIKNNHVFITKFRIHLGWNLTAKFQQPMETFGWSAMTSNIKPWQRQ